MGYWLKLYTDVLDDPKYFRLSEEAKLGMYELMLVAKKIENGELTGKLPTIDDIAFHTRKSCEQWKKIIPELEEIGFVIIEQDLPKLKNYVKRQNAIPDNVRSRQYRKKHNSDVMESETVALRDYHDSVTNRDGETDKKQIREETDKRVDLSIIDPLVEHFNKISFLEIPSKNSGEFQIAWFEPLHELIEMTGSDKDAAILLIDRALKKADGNFMVSSPKSLLKTFRSEYAQVKRNESKDIGKEFKAEEFLKK